MKWSRKYWYYYVPSNSQNKICQKFTISKEENDSFIFQIKWYYSEMQKTDSAVSYTELWMPKSSQFWRTFDQIQKCFFLFFHNSNLGGLKIKQIFLLKKNIYLLKKNFKVMFDFLCKKVLSKVFQWKIIEKLLKVSFNFSLFFLVLFLYREASRYHVERSFYFVINQNKSSSY